MQILLLDVQFQEQLLQAGIHVPIHVAQVVTVGVIAEIGEFHRDAAPGTAALPMHGAGKGARHHQRELLEFTQEIGREQFFALLLPRPAAAAAVHCS